MPIVCHGCGHRDVDHEDGVCYHDSPEDKCVEHPDLGRGQCRCERYVPVRIPLRAPGEHARMAG